MIELVLPDIYKIDIPLPKNPLKSLNSYLVQGSGRNLLIDTGFNCPESQAAMTSALITLGISMADTDLFITHLHSDHAGLVKHLATTTTRVWMGEADARILMESADGAHWQLFSAFLQLSGLLSMGVEDDITHHPGYKYASEPFDRYITISEGFKIEVGQYRFQALATPGHTAGHMCLFDAEQKVLIAGDHILATITPNITVWKPGDDALGGFISSLDKIGRLDIDLVLPGHRSIIHDCRGRIAELKVHHDKRMAEVTKIIGEDRLTAAQVASRMQWALDYREWSEFPWGQKLFATGEAMAHLYHLALMEKLRFTAIDNILYFEKI